jgi:hypothetical protein
MDWAGRPIYDRRTSSPFRHPEPVESCPLGTGKIESPKAIPQGEGSRERTESTIRHRSIERRTRTPNPNQPKAPVILSLSKDQTLNRPIFASDGAKEPFI